MRMILVVLAAALAWASVGLSVEAASVKAVVNGAPITDYQINQRALFMRLERRGNSNSDRLNLAREQLITEALQLQEADRLGIAIPDLDVDRAYERVAASVQVSVGRLNELLNAGGVNSDTLKDRLRAQLAWQQVVAAVVQPRVQISELDLDLRAAEQLPEASYDYILKEIVFVIPQGSNISARSRTNDANEYRRLFTGCDSAVQLSLSFNDAAVRDIGRRHSTQLPEALAGELAGLNVGDISTPRTVQNGVQLLAICSKTAARDVTFIKSQLRQEVGNERLQAEADKYLQELRDAAEIEIR